jgi:hypothetical protein
MHILDACIGAHIGGNFALSIPVLLTQVEGIASENFGHAPRTMNIKYYKKYFTPFYEGKRELSNIAGKALLEFITEYIINHFKDATDDPFSINRHGILHGNIVDYANEASSLRLILTLNLIQNSFRYVTSSKSSKYHKVSCGIGKRLKGEKIFYPGEFRAKLCGKKPCGVCCKGSL